MENILRDILVPVDFRDPSIKALTFARNLALRTGGKIHLLHVLEVGGLFADLFLSVDEVVKITDQAKNKLRQVADEVLLNHNIEVATMIERGRPHQKILDVARDIQPRFIILGENHQGDTSEQVLGSTVEQVTLNSPVAVITTKGDYADMGSLMLVPLDLTQKTAKKITNAIHFAKQFNLEICLVSALIGGISTRESRIYKKLRNARKTIEDNGVRCTMKLFPRSETPPYHRVLEYSSRINASIIMVMTHQEGFTYDNYIGAFAHHIINESKIPVMSLTSVATSLEFDEVLKDLLDPLSILARDQIKPVKGPRFWLRKSNPDKE
jgi:nucleotide-binding universal stress UspA family protein